MVLTLAREIERGVLQFFFHDAISTYQKDQFLIHICKLQMKMIRKVEVGADNLRGVLLSHVF